MIAKHLSSLLLLSLMGCGGRAVVSPAADGGVTDLATLDLAPPLPSGIHALTGLSTDLPTDDLQPLKQMIGNAPLVGLGESIHTSGGYHDAKARLIQFLVKEMGFRVLLLETPRMDAQVTTDYVKSCTGTPEQAASGIFPVFASSTTRDLLTWLCQYNQQHPTDPVSFYGFDMQEPWNQGKLLNSYLQKSAPSDAAMLTAGLSECDGVWSSSEADYYAKEPTPKVDSDQRTSCQNGVAATSSYFSTHKDALVAASSIEEFTLAKLALDGLGAWEEEAFYFSSNISLSYLARDQEMANTVESLRTLWFPNSKAMLWAHNYHLQKDGEDDVDDVGPKHMGSFLHADFKGDYYPIGLVGYQVDIDWPTGMGSPCAKLPTPDDDSVEGMLHALDQSYLLVDLSSSSAEKPFFDPTQDLNFDGVYDGEAVAGKIADQFSALVFLDHSPAMTPLFWNACP